MITSLTIKKELDVQIPIIPNFIKVGTENISIKDFTEDELKRIGKSWLENLIEKSKS